LAQKIEFNKLPKNVSILLEDNFRKKLMEESIGKAGSMHQLGRVMGYIGNAPNWSVKQIIQGNQGIPLFRLERLCGFMKLPLEEVEKHVEEIR
jgi:hypothetical protein